MLNLLHLAQEFLIWGSTLAVGTAVLIWIMNTGLIEVLLYMAEVILSIPTPKV